MSESAFSTAEAHKQTIVSRIGPADISRGTIAVNGQIYVPVDELAAVAEERDGLRRRLGLIGAHILDDYDADDKLWDLFARAGLDRNVVSAIADVVAQVRTGSL